MHTFLYHTAAVEASPPLRLSPGPEGSRFVQINPPSHDLYRGVLADTEIEPTKTGGTWFPSPPPSNYNGTVILHLHGGSYAIGEGRPGDAAYAAESLTTHVASYALFLSYRLASNPLGRFPAAVQDALSAYAYLLSQGFPSSRIILSGDSAGAHIALSLLRYLSSAPDTLPSPRAALLWSPPVDLVSARDPSSITKSRRYGTDYVAGNLVAWGARKFIADLDVSSDLYKPYFSPLGHAFACKTPIWIAVGELEVFLDEDVRFVEQMRAVDGNMVGVHVIGGAPHDVMFVGNLLGFESEVRGAGEEASRFIASLQ